MENKIHRAVVSVCCTLMLSSAFLTVGDGMLFARAPVGPAAEARALVSIVRATGNVVTLDDELARELGFPLHPGEKAVEMKARAVMNSETKTKRKVYIPADSVREYLIFIVDGKEETRLYLGTMDGIFRRAIVDDGDIKPISDPDGKDAFEFELALWESILGASKIAK